MAHPLGNSPLAERILTALGTGAEHVIVVSDGHDDAPQVLRALLNAWRQRVDPHRHTSVVHLNPVFDTDALTMAPIAEAVPTVGIRSAHNLPSLVGLARFGEGRSGLQDLRAHLRAAVQRYLGQTP